MINSVSIMKEAVRRALRRGMLTPTLPLNAPQIEGLEGYAQLLADPSVSNYNAYADSPGGTGKTGLFGILVKNIYQVARENGLGSTFRTVINAPSNAVAKQTRRQLIAIAPELESAISLNGSGRKDLSRPIIIGTDDFWLDAVENGLLSPDNMNLGINDEAHTKLSPRRIRNLNERLAGVLQFGVTASAAYDEEKRVELTHPHRIYHLDVTSAVERGFLTDYVHIHHQTMRLMPEMLNGEEIDLSNADFTMLKRQEWARLVTQFYATGVDMVTGEAISDKIGVAFAADTRAADDMAAMLNKEPILQRKALLGGYKSVAASIHSYNEDDTLLQAFENGDNMIAEGDKIFMAGWDFAPVKFVAVDPGTSVVETIQKIARGQRPWTNPRTGQKQGLLILQGIPYIGDPDPRKDELAKGRALANTATALKIFKKALTLAPGREPVQNKKPKGPGGQPIVRLPPRCEVVSYVTEEETLTISKLIDAAQEPFYKPLTEQQILRWALATRDKTGHFLSHDDEHVWDRNSDGSFTLIEDETGSAIDTAIAKGGRGLRRPDGSPLAGSLRKLLILHGYIDEQPDLTEAFVLDCIKATLEVTGEVPARNSPEVWGYDTEGKPKLLPNEKWLNIDANIINRHRGTIRSDGSAFAESLFDFEVKYGFKPERNLTAEEIIDWIEATKEKTGKLISRNSKVIWRRGLGGKFEIVKNLRGGQLTGENLDIVFKNKLRGLRNEDGSHVAKSVSDFLRKYGYKYKKHLTKDEVINWCIATQEKTGQPLIAKTSTVWRSKPDGKFEVVKGMTGRAIDKAIMNKGRGLMNDDGSVLAKSLADFRDKYIIDINTRNAVEIVQGEARWNSSNTPITRENVANLFSELSGGLVDRTTSDQLIDRLADAVIAKLGMQHIPASAEQRGITKPSPETALPTALVETRGRTSIGDKPETASSGIDFSAFSAPAFAQADARGHSMLSSLRLAQAAFFAGNSEEMRADFSKFAELFVHRTLMAVNADQLPISIAQKRTVDVIVKSYRQNRAMSELTKPNIGTVTRRELSDLMGAFNKFMAIVSVAAPERFPSRLVAQVRTLIAPTSSAQVDSEDAQLLQHGYDLATWFNAQFGAITLPGAPKGKLTETARQLVRLRRENRNPSEGRSSQAAGKTIPPLDGEAEQKPFTVPSSILKVLGITEQELTTALSGPAGRDYATIINSAQKWTEESPAIKRDRNKDIERKFSDVAEEVATMVRNGKNIHEIMDDLNHLTVQQTSSFRWDADLLLRGAVLTSANLPLEVFSRNRSTVLDTLDETNSLLKKDRGPR